MSFLPIFVSFYIQQEIHSNEFIQREISDMEENVKNSALRAELRERIIDTAVEAFTKHGIKSITMDEIAASLGISKRTLYEVFSDKETLLEACVLRRQEKEEQYLKEILAVASNVLEVILKLFQYSIEQFHATNKKFFEEIKKYPRVSEMMMRRHDRNSEAAIQFFKEGVSQGIFRDDVNFEIMGLLVREQLDLLMNTDICQKYSFLSVYESIMFTYLRGISTERGAQELENFIREYRRNKR